MKLGLGTVKGKIVAGVLAAGVISGTGVVFANTDAGENLREWYNSMFNQSVATIEEDVTAYGESQLPGLLEEYEGLKTDAELDIDLTRELETNESLNEILAAKMSHIESLDEEQQAILESIGAEYYNVFLDGYFEIQRLQAEGLAYATNDLTDFTDEVGQEAVTQMTTDLNTARDEAVTELEDAIREAKETLTAEIENQEEITTRNLMNQIDWHIEDLRDEVQDLLTGLVEEQQAIITAAAQELENDALEALDEVVSGINE
ncbi:hypothetical protein GMD78_04640 [Ornithinibacillus sp. L9]|uniref:Uncharacterized protein n=1 Tax=Ornithinibacillus caprae TaxID=2678566 RepID=A0A6N8FK64_9BACI|nr:hypothetical protein [Ornithinibacillus caprae]MUK87688.1 hypothetical protein [Ornithinibacillus caprae]